MGIALAREVTFSSSSGIAWTSGLATKAEPSRSALTLMGEDEEVAGAVERSVFFFEAAVTSSLSYMRRVLFLLSIPEEGRGQERVSNCTFLAVREVEERVRPLELELRDFLQFVSISLPFRDGRRKEKREE